jgi:GMP synthase (glutamine-hydrolysing)
MVNLSNARKDHILKNNHFKSENEFQNHLEYIKEEEKKLDFDNRTREVRNWLDNLN